MEHANTTEQRRVVSYANAVKGGRKAQSEKPRLSGAGDDRVEAAPVTQKTTKPAQPEKARKPGPAEALKAAHKAAQQEATKSDAKGAQVATQERPPQARQGAVDHEPKSAQRDTQGRGQPKQPKTQELAKPSATGSFSYAQAVKGIRSLTIREPKGVGHAEGTDKESSQPGNEHSSEEKHDVAEPARAESPKSEARQGEESRHHEAKQPDSPLKEVEQHPSKGLTPPVSGAPLISNDRRRDECSGDERSDGSVAQAPVLVRTADDTGVGLYNPAAPPFSARDVSSPFLRLPSNASSPTRASASPYRPLSQHISYNVPTNVIRLPEHINHARLRELIAAHDRGELLLWNTQEEWDAEIVCQGMVWRLHRQILCRDSDWFRDRLAPILANVNHSTVRVQLSMDEHQPVQLGQVLYYIYNHTFQSGESVVNGDRPSGEPIRRCIFSCISAASIGCWRMFEHGLYDLDYATQILPGILQAYDSQLDIRHIYEPLFLALQMLYEQGPRPELFRLRVKIAHFLDVTLLLLLKNDGFRLAFADKWVSRLYGHMAAEHKFFQHQGCLPPPLEQHADRWGVAQQVLVGVSDRLPRYQDFVSGKYGNNREEDGMVVIPEEITFALCAADSAIRTHDATLASMRRHIEIGHQFAAERDAVQRGGAQLIHLRRAVGLPAPRDFAQPGQAGGVAEGGRGLCRQSHRRSERDGELALRREERHFGRLNVDFNETLDAAEQRLQTIGEQSAAGRSGVGAVMGGGGEESEGEEGEGEGGKTTPGVAGRVAGDGPVEPPSPPMTAHGEDRPRAASPSPGPGEPPLPVPVTAEDTASVDGQGGSSSPGKRRRGSREDSPGGSGSGSPTGAQSPHAAEGSPEKQRGGGSPTRSASCDSTTSAETAPSPTVAPPTTPSLGQVPTEDGANVRRSWWETVMGEEGARFSWWDVVMSWARDGGG